MKKQNPSSKTFTTNTAIRISSDKIELTITKDNSIKKQTQISLHPGTIEQGVLTNPQSFNEKLKQLYEQNPLLNKYISLGIPEHTGFIKTYPIENSDSDDINQKIIELSENQLPLPPEELYIDWQWVEKNKLVLISAIPKKTINDYIEVLAQQNLTPLTIETTSITLRRITPPPEKPVLVIDADTTTTLIVVEPKTSVNLSAISQSETPNQLNPQLKNTIIDMINYYNKKFQQPISKILYTGNLTKQIASILPNNIPSSPIKLPAQIQHSQYLGYSLSTLPIFPPGNPNTINLVPLDIQNSYDSANTNQLKKISLVISSIFLIILNLVTAFTIFLTIKKQHAINQPEEVPIADVDSISKIKELNDQSKTIIDIIGQKQTFRQSIEKIFNTLPQDITIKQISFDPQTQSIAINGFADTQEQVLKYKNTLSHQEGFINVNLPFSSLAQRSNLDFTIELKWIPSK